jgi:hypothetical protein
VNARKGEKGSARARTCKSQIPPASPPPRPAATTTTRLAMQINELTPNTNRSLSATTSFRESFAASGRLGSQRVSPFAAESCVGRRTASVPPRERMGGATEQFHYGRKGVSPGYCRIGDHFLKQFATVCGHLIRNRCAIQSIVITVSALKRAAIFTLTASVFRRRPNSCPVGHRTGATSRLAHDVSAALLALHSQEMLKISSSSWPDGSSNRTRSPSRALSKALAIGESQLTQPRSMSVSSTPTIR